MRYRNIALGLFLAASAATLQAAARESTPPGVQASIPFINMNSSIRDWQADGRDGIWVQDSHRQWYYGELAATCHGLDFAVRVGFNTRGTTTFDKFGEIIVPGHDRCPLKSFTKSAAPPGHEDSGTAGSVE